MLSFIKRSVNAILILLTALSPMAGVAQRLPQGSACPVTTNQPYRSPDVSTVYVVTPECQKRPIFNPDVYFSHFDDWQRVIFLERHEVDAIPDHALKFLPWGQRRVFQNGSLVKTTDDPRVFLLENGAAHPIESESAFKDLGFSFDQIEDVSPDVLTKFTTKQEMIKGADTAPESLVFKYADDPRVYELKREGDALVKEHIQTDAQLRMLVRPDRIAILPRWRTFPDRGQNPSQNVDVTAPVVSITAPPADATVSGEVVISATATDNVGVTEVRFFIGSILLKTDAEAPYSASFDSRVFTNGTYNVSVMASDAKGNKTTVFSRLKIDNTTPDIAAPTVEFTAPAANATVSGSITLSVSAADAEGVTNVAFKIGSVTLSTDASAPYAATLDTTAYANGSYTLTAIATDAAGNQGTATRMITIANSAAPVPDVTAPTLSFTAPVADATVNGSVTVTASASDDVGVVSVQFRVGSTVIATDTSSPYSATLETSAYANGALTITAVATDAAGNQGTATRNVTIQNVVTPAPDATAPTVSITAPASNATVSGSTTITASASDNVGVSSVQFRIGSTTISTDTSSPYSATLDTTAYTNGSYTLTVVATDAAGNQGTATRSITVSNTVVPPADVTAPSVSFTSPANAATVSGTITLQASASDAVGVVSVQFLVNSVALSTDTSSPYSATLDTTAYANAAYILTVIATDAAGNQGTTTRTIMVSNQAPTPPPVQAALNNCYANAGTDAGSAINLVLTPSRTSGVAPLSVFFETEGTTAQATSRPFHELAYCWDFGETSAGSFTHTGKSKNRAFGPVAAHVFETPGTYTVTMNAKDSQGRVAARTVQITVTSPDTVFSGTNTRCFSPSGNFSGCPSGAQQITTGDLATIQSHIATGRRLLLHRGETYSGGLSINVAGPGTIGAYGTGNRPVINGSGAFFSLSGNNPLFSDWRIMDMDARNGGNVIEMQGKTTHLLALRLRGENVPMGVFAGLGTIQSLIGQGYANQDISDAMAIVDSEFYANGGGAGTVFAAGRRMMMLGNLMRNVSAEQGQHVIRVTYLDRGVFMGNDLGEVQPDGHMIKLHAPKFNDAGLGQGKYTEKVVIADNVFRGTGGSRWTVILGPQNGGSDERLRDIMVERNYFLPGTGDVRPLIVSAVDVTVRDNIFDRGSRGTCIQVDVEGIEPPPVRVTLANNTCRSAATTASLAFVSGVTSQVQIHNNLVVSPSGFTSRVLEGGSATAPVTQENNVLTSSPAFSNSSLTSATDYRLTAGSPAVGAGSGVLASPWDYTGVPRAFGTGAGASDAGAWDF